MRSHAPDGHPVAEFVLVLEKIRNRAEPQGYHLRRQTQHRAHLGSRVHHHRDLTALVLLFEPHQPGGLDLASHPHRRHLVLGEECGALAHLAHVAQHVGLAHGHVAKVELAVAEGQLPSVGPHGGLAGGHEHVAEAEREVAVDFLEGGEGVHAVHCGQHDPEYIVLVLLLVAEVEQGLTHHDLLAREGGGQLHHEAVRESAVHDEVQLAGGVAAGAEDEVGHVALDEPGELGREGVGGRHGLAAPEEPLLLAHRLASCAHVRDGPGVGQHEVGRQSRGEVELEPLDEVPAGGEDLERV